MSDRRQWQAAIGGRQEDWRSTSANIGAKNIGTMFLTQKLVLVCYQLKLVACLRCSMGFIVLTMCGLRKLKMQMKTSSRLTASLLRICVATLLLSHACRSIVRNSVWHDRQSLFTYATVRFAYSTKVSSMIPNDARFLRNKWTTCYIHILIYTLMVLCKLH